MDRRHPGDGVLLVLDELCDRFAAADRYGALEGVAAIDVRRDLAFADDPRSGEGRVAVAHVDVAGAGLEHVGAVRLGDVGVDDERIGAGDVPDAICLAPGVDHERDRDGVISFVPLDVSARDAAELERAAVRREAAAVMPSARAVLVRRQREGRRRLDHEILDERLGRDSYLCVCGEAAARELRRVDACRHTRIPVRGASPLQVASAASPYADNGSDRIVVENRHLHACGISAHVCRVLRNGESDDDIAVRRLIVDNRERNRHGQFARSEIHRLGKTAQKRCGVRRVRKINSEIHGIGSFRTRNHERPRASVVLVESRRKSRDVRSACGEREAVAPYPVGILGLGGKADIVGLSFREAGKRADVLTSADSRKIGGCIPICRRSACVRRAVVGLERDGRRGHTLYDLIVTKRHGK